jgi:iron complex outermembrane receptor protein
MQSSHRRASSAKRVAFLFGTTSFASLAAAFGAQAQQVAQAQTAQALTNEPPEQVLITGSLIRGAQAVGAPVTTLGQDDFAQAGVVSVGDLLTTLPEFLNHVSPSFAAGGFQNFINRINIHNLNGTDTRTLMLIDGMYLPAQGQGAIQFDPSIIPSLALDRVDVLANGASAVYGSQAVAGVVNLILKRGYNGATLQTVVGAARGGDFNTTVQGLYGRTWDGGDVTVSYQYSFAQALKSRDRSYYTQDFTPWGLDNQTPVASARPGIVSVGPPVTATGASTQLAATCANCFSIPTGQNGTSLSWATIAAHPGITNAVNPALNMDVVPADQQSAATFTFDQDLLPWLQFNASGFYSNRRDQTHHSDPQQTSAVPTTNPFYPTGIKCTTNPTIASPAGIPAGCTPTNLQVSYLFSEDPHIESASEISERWTAGFTLRLPGAWEGRTFFGDSQEGTFRHQVNNLQNLTPLDVSAALGATVAATPASNASPGIPSFVKPSSVPYLNLFCDPSSGAVIARGNADGDALSCNDPATLQYISQPNSNAASYLEHEAGLTFDGPVFDLPGGPVRAAIGTDYLYQNYWIVTTTSPVTSLVQSTAPDALNRTIYAAFAQVNVPIVGDANKLPFVERLELEVSGRYDSYSDSGHTSNPRISADWTLGYGFTLRGSWGTNFVAPSFKAKSKSIARNITPFNAQAFSALNTSAITACPTGATAPAPGSAAAVLNPTCDSTLNRPLGIQISSSGGDGGLAGVVLPAGFSNGPETAKNWVLGFEYAPTDFLNGLDVQLTWWRVRIDGQLQGLAPTTGNGLNDPLTRFLFILPGDPLFQSALDFAYAAPTAGPNVPPIPKSAVKWLEYGGTRNTGSRDVEGLDFNLSYDWDLGNLGAWNAGVTGSYFFHDFLQLLNGGPVNNAFNDSATGESRSEQLRYRARLGWADGPYSVTAFMDYISHSYTTNTLPGASALAPFPDLVTTPDLINLVPAQYTFDLSFGYKTGSMPALEYLRNISVFLTVNNIFDRDPPFGYGGRQNPYAYVPTSINPLGRYWRLGITKTL